MDSYLQNSRADVNSMKNTQELSQIIDEFLQSSSQSSVLLYRSQLISLKTTLRERFNFFLEGHLDEISSIALTSTNYLISCSKDKSIQIWNLPQRRLESILTGHTDSVNAVAVLHSNKYIISGSSDKTVRVWEFKPPFSHSILNGHIRKVMNVVVTADDLYVCSSCDTYLKIWDLRTLTEHLSIINFVTPAYSLVATGGEFPLSSKWHYSAKIEGTLLEQFGSVVAFRGDAIMAISKNSKLLAIIESVQIRMIDTKNSRTLRRLSSHDIAFCALAFSNDSRYLVAGSKDSSMTVWNLYDYRQKSLQGQHCWIKCMQFTNDNQCIVAAFKDKSIKILSFETGRCIEEISLHSGWVSAVAAMDNLKYLVTGSRDNTVRKWDLATQKQVSRYNGHTSDVICIKLSQDNRIMATGSADKTVRVWRMDIDKHEPVLEGHSGPVQSLSFFRNDKYLVSASRDHTYRVWLLEIKVKSNLKIFNIS